MLSKSGATKIDPSSELPQGVLRQRRNLLIVCLILLGILIFEPNITKMNLIFITIDKPPVHRLYFCLWIVGCYFFVRFFSYAMAHSFFRLVLEEYLLRMDLISGDYLIIRLDAATEKESSKFRSLRREPIKGEKGRQSLHEPDKTEVMTLYSSLVRWNYFKKGYNHVVRRTYEQGKTVECIVEYSGFRLLIFKLRAWIYIVFNRKEVFDYLFPILLFISTAALWAWFKDPINFFCELIYEAP
jgi:hypothetical protein